MLKKNCSEVCHEEGVEFVLHAQYVTSGGRIAKVICGSGMSEESSGAISDWSFYCRCERDFLFDEEVRSTYGIITYVRYRDDFLIITDGAPHNLMLDLFWG